MNKIEVKKLSEFRQELAQREKQHRERGDEGPRRETEIKLETLEYIESLLGVTLR